jgi:hypothetical protein
MRDDRLRQSFEQIVKLPVDIPSADCVLARGRQRQGRLRLRISTIAATVLLAAGFGAPQVSGSLAANARLSSSVPPGAGIPQISNTSIKAANGSASPTRHDVDLSSTARPSHPVPGPPHVGHANNSRAPRLPPPGDGQLILALDSAHRYVMTRIGAASAPVQVPWLKADARAPPVLATNPAGGWVVTLASRQARRRAAPARLAWVRASGQSVRFGPKFSRATITSVAVSLDGKQVAVALAGQSGRARIEVLPLPGHSGTQRSWRGPAGPADLVTGLSWAPDGRHLSYMAGLRATTSTANSPLTMDTAVRVLPAPVFPRWQRAMNTGMTCVPVAMAWLGRTGRYAVLKECASTGTVVLQTEGATGTAAGQPLVVAHQLGCKPAALDPDASGNRILVSYCGIYLDDHGKLTRALGPFTAAALSG